MKGYVPTPAAVVDLMVGKLFGDRAPSPDASVLDPGCGEGVFVDGIIRYCAARGWNLPRIVGVELDEQRCRTAQQRFRQVPQVEIRHADFLDPLDASFDYVIGNPPYVSILGLDLEERQRYRSRFRVATGRFDLYALFFEQALRLLASAGRLVFITPEKFLYVETARSLRELLLQYHLEELQLVDEATFGGLVTYPLISTVIRGPSASLPTRVTHRDGRTVPVVLRSSHSWLPTVQGFSRRSPSGMVRLADISVRISCGVATGADAVFLIATGQLSEELRPFAHRTVSGRQITPDHRVDISHALLAPYDAHGRLLGEGQLGALGTYLGEPHRKALLERRSCVAQKPWYAYHDSLPLDEMLRPKLLCKDITARPFFVTDATGELMPRHSVYYVVPRDPQLLEPLGEYLNSVPVAEWLHAHCQRAANGFLRLQSHILKQLPVPAEFAAKGDPVGEVSQRALLIA